MSKSAKKKFLKVKFVGDKDIANHIVHIDQLNIIEQEQPPSTPKRKKEEKQQQTPGKTRTLNSPTPGTGRRVSSAPTTPRRTLIAKDVQTPRALRQQVRNQVAKRLEETCSATLEDTDEEEQSGDEENVEPKPQISTPSTKPMTSLLLLGIFLPLLVFGSLSLLPSSSQLFSSPLSLFYTSLTPLHNQGVSTTGSSYFDITGRRSQTSNHTLAQLGRDMDELMALPRLLADVAPAKHRNALDLQAKYRLDYFPHWYHLLREDFNVLLYGFGSKLDLLEKFCSEYLADHDHLLIHGFFPGLAVKHILNSITLEILEQNRTYTSVADQLDFILRHYKNTECEELYLVIGNVDGPNLRSDKVQSILCQLAACPNVHLLASIDHVNAPLMWDQVKLGKFRWVWTNVTDPTARYLSETAYEDGQQAATGSRLALSSLIHVFSSLPSNTRKIFLILVRHQLEHLSRQRSSSTSYLGMAFHDLVEESKEAFLVNSQITIRAHLAEFKDHRVIVVRKGPDGTEYLYIPLDSAILEEFLEQASVD